MSNLSQSPEGSFSPIRFLFESLGFKLAFEGKREMCPRETPRLGSMGHDSYDKKKNHKSSPVVPQGNTTKRVGELPTMCCLECQHTKDMASTERPGWRGDVLGARTVGDPCPHQATVHRTLAHRLSLPPHLNPCSSLTNVLAAIGL